MAPGVNSTAFGVRQGGVKLHGNVIKKHNREEKKKGIEICMTLKAFSF